MSKLLFAGSRTDCIKVISGSIYGSTNFINGAYTDAGIAGSGVAQGTLTDPASAPLLEPYTVEAGHSLYFHGQFGWTDGFGGGQAILWLVDPEGYQWLLLEANGQLQYNAGTGAAPNWQNLGAAYGNPGGYNNPAAIDIKLDLDAGGNHTVMLAYGGTAVVGPIGFSQPLLTGIQAFQLSGEDFRTGSTWSELLCTEDISTIGAHVATVRATGAGAHSDWTGDYTDVNETLTNDANSNNATAAGLVQSYPMGNIALPAGYEIMGAFHWLRGKNSGTPPENIQSLIRTSAGVDHQTANLAGPEVTYSLFGARYNVNPDTNAAWTQADWNAPVQLGFASEA